MATTYQGTCGRVPGVRPGANFKEAVCVDTSRVYDSVSDKNCLEDLQVSFPEEAQQVIGSCCSLKLKEVEVENVYMDVEPIPFNKGFYTVDLTFFFSARFEAQLPDGSLVTVCGVTTFTRKMILYGSEGDVKVFCSDQNGTNQNNGMPRVCLQVSTPVALGSRVIDCGSGFRSSCGCNTNCNPCGCNTGCNQNCGCDCNTGCNTGCLPDGCDPCGPQRQVLITLAKKVVSWNSLTKVTAFLDIFNSYVETNLSLTDMAYFAEQALKLDLSTAIEQGSLTGRGDGVLQGYKWGSTTNYVYQAEDILPTLNSLVNPYTRDLTAEDLHLVVPTRYK